ncbi:hypothetical protein FM038_021085 [Shewanella eurypsychrophilus]|uniref:Uncharacterized protein n=1 Tax=Shewanella eurypsychrophilus TaxID=2593656 RepID=A0ABX6VH56_9GAMM|nr:MULTISPECIES: hypothetical protein [Shewanella]QFU24396.1 hypothetical protein FS418_22790 [Shewanella sp. YLB-09]QPG59596.1 hypothetical protein FM038_021085 [Shewanella eurypsychrophilus]
MVMILAEGRTHGGGEVALWMRSIQRLCSEKRRSRRTGEKPHAFPWHLLHRDMVNVIMMSGTSLTMPSRHLLILNIRCGECHKRMDAVSDQA